MPEKRKLICNVECPHCENSLNIFKTTETITPAVKADKRESFSAEKNVQTKL